MLYTLDTNAVIYYLDKDPKAYQLLRQIFQNPHHVCISTMTELELFSGPTLSKADLELLRIVLFRITVIPLTSDIAHYAALIRRSKRTPSPDSAIAATAILTNSTLLTRNVKDFEDIPNLQVQEI